jgi:hypothetical protein
MLGLCKGVIRKPTGAGALFQDRLADGTVDRNITLTLTFDPLSTPCEGGVATSTVAPRVVGGDENGSLNLRQFQ